MSNYRIGTYAGGVAAIKDLCVYVNAEPESTYQEYATIAGDDFDGAPIEAGLPQAEWRWPELAQGEFDALCDFTGGASAPVYIQTRLNTGASLSEWDTFLAVMHRPKSTPEGRITHRDVSIQFTAMVAA